jgi:hypothetical protein
MVRNNGRSGHAVATLACKMSPHMLAGWSLPYVAASKHSQSGEAIWSRTVRNMCSRDCPSHLCTIWGAENHFSWNKLLIEHQSSQSSIMESIKSIGKVSHGHYEWGLQNQSTSLAIMWQCKLCNQECNCHVSKDAMSCQWQNVKLYHEPDLITQVITKGCHFQTLFWSLLVKT